MHHEACGISSMHYPWIRRSLYIYLFLKNEANRWTKSNRKWERGHPDDKKQNRINTCFKNLSRILTFYPAGVRYPGYNRVLLLWQHRRAWPGVCTWKPLAARGCGLRRERPHLPRVPASHPRRRGLSCTFFRSMHSADARLLQVVMQIGEGAMLHGFH